jgi:hypothetical protein
MLGIIHVLATNSTTDLVIRSSADGISYFEIPALIVYHHELETVSQQVFYVNAK